MNTTYFKILVALGDYFREELTNNQFKMYTKDLEVLTQEELIKAIQIYKSKPENKKFPFPAELISLVKGSESLDNIVGKINEAIGKFGASYLYSAKEFIGSVGWKAVESYGGWQEICKPSNRSFINNQIKLFIKDQLKREEKVSIESDQRKMING